MVFCVLKKLVIALCLSISTAGWAAFIVGYAKDQNVFGNISSSDLLVTSGEAAKEAGEAIATEAFKLLTTLPSPENFCFYAFAVVGLVSLILHTVHECCSIRILGAVTMFTSCLAIAMSGAVANPSGVAMYKCLEATDGDFGNVASVTKNIGGCLFNDTSLSMSLQFAGATVYLVFQSFVVMFVFWNAGTKIVTRVQPASASHPV